jgi:hypothetical protein
MKILGTLVGIALSSEACTTYTSIGAIPPAPTSETIRLSLTDGGGTQMLGPLGARVRSVEGEVRSVNDSAVTMSVAQGHGNVTSGPPGHPPIGGQ